MRIALGSDLRCELTAALERTLRERGFDLVLLGALDANGDDSWPTVGRVVGEAVARGECAQGVVCCWTGTGVSIAANKVCGVRAALCSDEQTARGARLWNDANVLALSIRSTTPALAQEILAAWFSAEPEAQGKGAEMISALKTADDTASERRKQRGHAHA
ncbi:MAG: RpiB/LacA/LacB family sugar-phosphate isomerase [Candidatus Tyrphobacter sp.]